MHASTREGRVAGYVGIGVAAALATAGLVYLFDSNSGNRRASMRDKLHRVERESRQFMGRAKRDTAHRARNVYREAANRMQRRSDDDTNWSPAPRVAAGAAATTMVLGALRRRSSRPLAYALAAGSAMLFARAVANVPLRELLGASSSTERADEGLVEFERTFEVHADLEDVYDAWRDVERWPRFMRHVRDIQRIDDTTYRWVVDGPAGMPIEYESQITADARDEMIAWRTTDGSVVHNCGVVQFEASEDGTRVYLRMGYRPPAGALGHAVAKLFRRDPQRQMDDDILRFKAFLETNMPPRDAAPGEESLGRRGREERGRREEHEWREDPGRVWH